MKHLGWGIPVLIGTLLRYWGISFGAPLTSNLYIRPDESLVIVSGALGVPSSYAYPAFFLELSALIFRLMGGDPATGFGLDPTPYYLAVRAMAALFGSATVVLVYLIARRVLDGPWPMMAALVYAVSPLAVRDAHYAVTDIPSVFFQTAVVWFALRYVDAEPGRAAREFWLATLALGLSMNTKYAGVLLATVLITGVWMRTKRTGEAPPWGRLTGAACGLVVLFSAINPFLLMDFTRAWKEIWSIVRALYLWQPGDPQWTLTYALWQVAKPLGQGSGGWAGAALAVAGMGYAVWKRDKTLLLIAQPGLSTFLVLLPFQHTVPYRYLLPALPALAILAVAVFARLPKLPRPVAIVGAALLLAAVEVTTSARLVWLLAEPDSRSLAGDWIQRNVPKSVPIVWLGGPECEPQFIESPESAQRRIEFAYRRYGPFSGAIVSAPYEMMCKAKREAGVKGWEVYRNPLKNELPAGEFALVTSEYPLRMTKFALPVASSELIDLRPAQTFPALRQEEGSCDEFELDRIDAWFLPFRPLGCVLRPGPNLVVRWVHFRPGAPPVPGPSTSR
ncbi:MAG TPA: glycosyltransferase family 39 protein [Bryobacteraceae bacterium]|nr:glycosyltransferase family 39 protein [Bryobacteraceae bacterium]HPT25582.1 glycosyltransferase family 39 protein [Bryobacteraceae bacterium]